MKTQHFPVVIELDEDGVFIVSCPTFRGCHSFGKTIDEALHNIREAIVLCIDELAQTPHTTNTFIGVRDIEVLVYA